VKRPVRTIGIAALLVAGAGGAALLTASSSAGDDTVATTTTTITGLGMAAIHDPALASSDPSDGDAEARLVDATGVPASDAAAPRAWTVGEGSVLGYAAADGRFCFEFRGLAGGCLGPGSLTDARPVDVTTSYGPGNFHVYGLALDGVTAVSVRVGESARPAALAHNSFYFSAPGLGGTDGVEGTVVATMSDGTTREASFGVSRVREMPVPS
jgi:hypothetical protein